MHLQDELVGSFAGPIGVPRRDHCGDVPYSQQGVSHHVALGLVPSSWMVNRGFGHLNFSSSHSDSLDLTTLDPRWQPWHWWYHRTVTVEGLTRRIPWDPCRAKSSFRPRHHCVFSRQVRYLCERSMWWSALVIILMLLIENPS
jgi:hypothetical protein